MAKKKELRAVPKNAGDIANNIRELVRDLVEGDEGTQPFNVALSMIALELNILICEDDSHDNFKAEKLLKEMERTVFTAWAQKPRLEAFIRDLEEAWNAMHRLHWSAEDLWKADWSINTDWKPRD